MAHRLLASIAHDLCSPVTGLMGLLQLLESGADGQLSEAQRTRLLRIRATVESIADVAERIRDLAVLESGNADLRLEEVDLARLLETVARSLEKEARAHAVELRLDLAPDLPRLNADPRRLRQVVTILLSVAMRRAGGSVLEVHAAAEGPFARVTLRETSRAIPAEALPAGFGEDGAGPSAESPSNPDGLRMSLARGLIELHGGRLTTSEGDRVEIARFTLPAKGHVAPSMKPRTPPSPRA